MILANAFGTENRLTLPSSYPLWRCCFYFAPDTFRRSIISTHVEFGLVNTSARTLDVEQLSTMTPLLSTFTFVVSLSLAFGAALALFAAKRAIAATKATGREGREPSAQRPC